MTAEWKTMDRDERRKTLRWNDCNVALRVILGGNGLRTPIVEIIADKARASIGPRGGERPPSRYVGGCLLPQCAAIEQAQCAVEEWWSEYLQANDQGHPPPSTPESNSELNGG